MAGKARKEGKVADVQVDEPVAVVVQPDDGHRDAWFIQQPRFSYYVDESAAVIAQKQIPLWFTQMHNASRLEDIRIAVIVVVSADRSAVGDESVRHRQPLGAIVETAVAFVVLPV